MGKSVNIPKEELEHLELCASADALVATDTERDLAAAEFERSFKSLGCDPNLATADGDLALFPFEVLTGITEAKRDRFKYWLTRVRQERTKAGAVK